MNNFSDDDAQGEAVEDNGELGNTDQNIEEEVYEQELEIEEELELDNDSEDSEERKRRKRGKVVHPQKVNPRFFLFTL